MEGPGKVTLVAGDVTDAASLGPALAGADGGVIFAASGSSYFSAQAVDHQGVVNTVAAAKAANLPGPVVLVSSCLVSPHNLWHPIRIMLSSFRYGLMGAKYQGEEALRASGLPYTVVRPGGLKDDPAGRRPLVAAQGDRSSGSVARADVAAVCVAALTDPAARGVTLELVAAKEGGDAGGAGAVAPLAEQIAGLFKGLKPDVKG